MATSHNANKLPLPDGTVTFLFTDIEGSTKLWETQNEPMRVALARHNKLLQRSIEDCGGHVVKNTGDGFLAVFATAPKALRAALAAQQALQIEPWPQEAPIRVRMSLHTGVAELRDRDYFGQTLNRAARLMALGHGGQALLSHAAYDLCCDQLPAGVTFKRLGEFVLKDLAREETVFQLCCPGLREEFPFLQNPLVPFADVTPSIAVLPFLDMSREGGNEYFADGLAEELLHVLAKIRGLRVASRTSAFSFKGKVLDIPTVAKMLNVSTILEGSVRTAGKRVRITAQLIDVATDSHLWSETYDRDLDDIFAVQDDISRSVVTRLRETLISEKPAQTSSAQVRDVVKGRSENAEAYRLYLHARFFANKFTRDTGTKAISYFQQAVELDPKFALAWAGLSSVYTEAANTGALPLEEGYLHARTAAQTALDLEPDLAEGHAALGRVQMMYDWDWKSADASLMRALELAPGDAEIVSYAAWLPSNLGRLTEAGALFRRAVVLDPLNCAAHGNLAHYCLSANLLDEAETAAKKMLELNSHGEFAHDFLGLSLLAQSRLDAALEQFNQEQHDTYHLRGLTIAHHALGRPVESDAALRTLIERHTRTSAFQIAQAHAYRGHLDLAFEWLERAFLQRDPGLTELKHDMLLRILHTDRRWQPFLRKMSLAD